MHCSSSSLLLILNLALLFWKLLVIEFLVDISEAFLYSVSDLLVNCPSARCASAANAVCRDLDVFVILIY
jgi:hypothetical protein